MFLASLILIPDIFPLTSLSLKIQDLLIPSLSLTPEIDNSSQWAWFALQFDLDQRSLIQSGQNWFLKEKEIVNLNPVFNNFQIVLIPFFGLPSHSYKSYSIEVWSFWSSGRQTPNLLLPRFLHPSRCAQKLNTEPRALACALPPSSCRHCVSRYCQFFIQHLSHIHCSLSDYQHSPPKCHCSNRDYDNNFSTSFLKPFETFLHVAVGVIF